MPRLAGNDPGYEFRIMRSGPGGSKTASPWGFTLDSVTTIISEVIPKPFAAGTWYGYRLGLEAVNGKDLRGIPDLEAYLTSRGFNPNQRLDSTRDRGYIAHDVLELLVGEPDAGIALGVCYVEESLFGTKYGRGVYDWWLSQTATFRARVRSEVPVWSLKLGYAGTADLIVPGAEILDLKTHKPAAGFTKPGQGPAYLGDLVQLRAYAMAWEEMGNAALQKSRIVIARSNGKWLEDTRQVPESFWLKCLEMYQEFKNVK